LEEETTIPSALMPRDFPHESSQPSNSHQSAEFIDTSRQTLEEIPLQARIDRQMAIICLRHERTAKTIKMFWGRRDCIDYIQTLVLNRGYGSGETRVDFRQEAMAALIALVELHEIQH
jgi:hypothetical protein